MINDLLLLPLETRPLICLLITLCTLTICAVTDVLVRRTSEVLIVIAVAAICLVDFSWARVGVGLLLALPWLIAVWRKQAGLGDVEISALLGLGFGAWGLVTLFLSMSLAVVTKKYWTRLASEYTPEDERQLAPVGLYYAVASGIVFFGLYAVQTTL